MTSLPSRKTSARKPSHLGSKIHSPAAGSLSTRLASIGRIGGFTGSCIIHRLPQPQKGTKSTNCFCLGPGNSYVRYVPFCGCQCREPAEVSLGGILPRAPCGPLTKATSETENSDLKSQNRLRSATYLARRRALPVPGRESPWETDRETCPWSDRPAENRTAT